MRLNKEIKVGLLVTITLIMGYVGFNYLKGKEIFPTTKTYYALYKDAKGLNTANEVMLNGFKVGRIQCIKMLPEEDYKILVTLAIDKEIKLTDTSIAKLEDTNLLGNKVIELIIKEGNLLQEHDTLLSETAQDLQTRFTESTLPTLDDARSITLLTNKFMQNLVENTDRINAIFNNLEKTSQALHKAINLNQKDLTIISQNLVHISNSLADQHTGIQPLLTKLNHLTNDFQNINLNELSIKANNILSIIEEGPLYSNFNKTLISLDNLLSDLRIQPNRYVHFSIFGANSIFSRHKTKTILPSAAK